MTDMQATVIPRRRGREQSGTDQAGIVVYLGETSFNPVQ